MQDVQVLRDPAAVEAALDPVRASILDVLDQPGSAASIAETVGLTRQKVNYHLKALEAHGLVELTAERAWGGITERLVRRVARQIVVSPDIVPDAVVDPDSVADRLSAGYLVAVNARAVSEVGAITAALPAETRLPTFTVDTTIGFASADERAAFAAELQAAVIGLAARYHHPEGRPHRLTVSSYPRPEESS